MKIIKSSFIKTVNNYRPLILASLITLFGLAIPNHLVAGWVWPWQGNALQAQIEQARDAQITSEQEADQARHEADAAKLHTKEVCEWVLVSDLLFAGLIAYLIKTRKVVQNIIKNEIVENVVREEVIVRSPAHELVPDMVVIDATNVLYGSWSAKHPSLLKLFGLLLELQKRKCAFKCFFDSCTLYKLRESSMGEADAFSQLCGEYPDNFVVVPGGTQADEFILDYAHSYGTLIISNDRYRDFCEKYNWLATDPKRRVNFAIHSGIIQIVPLGIQAPIPVTLADAETSLRSGLGKPAISVPNYHNSKVPAAKQPAVNGAVVPAMV